MTEEQINKKALKYYLKKKHSFTNRYVDEEDIRQRERIAYMLGCRDIKEEYKELIEAGKKWEELVGYIEVVSTEYRSSKTGTELYSYLMKKIVDKIMEINQRNNQQND